MQKNRQRIENLLGSAQQPPQIQQPIQQIPSQPQTTIQGQYDWANIPGAIYFYDDTGPGSYYGFTNFYKNYITIDGKVWPTTEHYYQAMKFEFPTIQEKIRILPEPRDAFNYARRNSTEVRQDWKSVNLQFMIHAVREKFKQSNILKKLLLDTGNRILVEDAKGNDSFFGAGADYTGSNHLGQILMQVRDELRGAPETNYQEHPTSYYIQKSRQSVTPTQPVQKPIQTVQQMPQIQQPQIMYNPPQQIISNDLTQQLQLLVESLNNLACALTPPEKRAACIIQ